jgi:hypothetical protein
MSTHPRDSAPRMNFVPVLIAVVILAALLFAALR